MVIVIIIVLLLLLTYSLLLRVSMIMVMSITVEKFQPDKLRLYRKLMLISPGLKRLRKGF